MMNLHSRAILLAVSSTILGSTLFFNAALAQNSSVTIDAPAQKKPAAHTAQKPKTAAAHPKKQDIPDIDKKPVSNTIPMDFSGMKKPLDQETTSSSKSDFDGPLKPDLGGNGMSPGMKFNW